MICDGAKIVSLREARLYTQQRLADLSRIDRRTIQRMEAGQPVSSETLHQVAAPLGVTAFDLLLDLDDMGGKSVDRTAGILLKPELSGLRLVEAISSAQKLDFDTAFEPWPEQVAVAGPFFAFLEGLNPISYDDVRQFSRIHGYTASSKMQDAARVNSELRQLAELEPYGLRVLFGEYTIYDREPRINGDTGEWYLSQRETVLAVAALRIAPLTTPSLWIPIKGKPAPSPVSIEDDNLDDLPSALMEDGFDDDDIPF